LKEDIEIILKIYSQTGLNWLTNFGEMAPNADGKWTGMHLCLMLLCDGCGDGGGVNVKSTLLLSRPHHFLPGGPCVCAVPTSTGGLFPQNSQLPFPSIFQLQRH
jgi:hypothetical protein